jgi:hypothetical protein
LIGGIMMILGKNWLSLAFAIFFVALAAGCEGEEEYEFEEEESLNIVPQIQKLL